MIINKLKQQFTEEIDSHIKILEVRKEEDGILCACCIIGEVDDDLEQLNKLRKHINQFND